MTQSSTNQGSHRDLGTKLKKSIAWQYVQTLFGTVFNFAVGIALARLLAPSDFGLFGAVSAIMNLLLLQVNFGWGSTILRAKTLDQRMLSSIFWLMQFMALILAIIVIVSSAWLGRFYNDDRFAPVIILVCLQFFITPFNNINGCLLRWKMRYDLISRISMVVTVITASLGVFLAYIGWGVYSLVATGLFSSILMTGMMACYAPWKPSFILSFDCVSPHFDFTWRLHLNNSLNLLSSRIDNIMIGKLTGLRDLGIYVKAFSLGRMPVDLLGSNLYQMFFTALSQVRDDHTDSIALFQKILAAMTFAIYLPLLILFLVGEGFVFYLYGEKWIGAVLPMQIMIVGSFATVISMNCGAFCDANNLVKIETPVQFANVILTVIAVVVGSKWGIVGVSAGISVKAFILLFLMKNVMAKGINLKWRDLWKPLWPNICATSGGIVTAMIAFFLLRPLYSERDLVYMVLLSGSATIGYGITWFFLAVKLKHHAEMHTLLETGKTICRKLKFIFLHAFIGH